MDNQAETGGSRLEMSGGKMGAALRQGLAPLEPLGPSGVPPWDGAGEAGNKSHMLERGDFQRTVFLLLTPAERWLCTFPTSGCRLKATAEATEDGNGYDRGTSGLYSLKSAVQSFKG